MLISRDNIEMLIKNVFDSAAMSNFGSGAFRITVFGFSAALSACSVLPGLNISEKSLWDSGEYVVVEGEKAQTYRVKRADEAAGYQVVALTPESLKWIRSRPAEGTTNELLASTAPDAVPPEYEVGPGDIIYVTVWDHPELTNPGGQNNGTGAAEGQLVRADGTLFYPYVGEFKAAGKTTSALRSYLTEQLARVIASPQVDVRVIEFRAKRVQVTGEVNNPGLLTLDDTPKGVLEAINEKGGLAGTASRRNARLIRDGHVFDIDLAGLTSGTRPSPNPVLQPGDILHVPDQSNDQVFMLGEVAQQQPLVLSGQAMSLTEALTRSGGLDKVRSDDGGVLVFRRPSNDASLPTIFTLDMSRPMGLLLAGEFELEPRDVVYVKSTDFAKYNAVIREILPTVTAIYQLDRLTE